MFLVAVVSLLVGMALGFLAGCFAPCPPDPDQLEFAHEQGFSRGYAAAIEQIRDREIRGIPLRRPR